jgi:hypothetical protein
MKDEKREQAIQTIADMMRNYGFNLEFKVKKKTQGVKVIIEVTQEQMNAMMDDMKQKMEK